MKIVRVILYIALIGGIVGYICYNKEQKQIHNSITHNSGGGDSRTQKMNKLVSDIKSLENKIEQESRELDKMLNDSNCDSQKLVSAKRKLILDLETYKDKLDELRTERIKINARASSIEECEMQIKKADQMIKEIKRLG